MEIFEFGVVDTLVVDLLQGVELYAQFLEAVALFGVFQLWQLREVDIHRMQCKHTDATIGVGVGPSVGDRAVVDRQDLQHTLAGRVDIVDHLLQVTEVSYAEACLGAQGEHRHERAGDLGVVDGHISLVKIIDHDLTVFQLRQVDGAVVTALPQWRDVFLAVESGELKLHLALGEVVGIEVHDPLVDVVLGHLHGFGRVPGT